MPQTVKSAERLMALLELLAERGPSRYGEITKSLDLPNSSGYQLVQTAVQRGFVEFHPQNRTYTVGQRLWQVAQAYDGHGHLVAVAQPVMDQLARSLDETVQLAQLDGLDNVYLAIAETNQPMKLVSSVGSRLPAHATGLGKALLAGLDPSELDRRLAGVTLQSFTANTISDPAELRAVLSRAREVGYAEDREEYVVGCRCVAMPISGPDGEVVAALSVSIPTPRYEQDLADRARRELAVAVSKINTTLMAVGSNT